MSSLPDLAPLTDSDYVRVLDHLISTRDRRKALLDSGRDDLVRYLTENGHNAVLPHDHPEVMAGYGRIESDMVIVDARLKDDESVIAKMRRFGEPLRVMLDVWGYRLVVASVEALETAAGCCAELWLTPDPSELLLRHGELQFAPWRDYRRRDHAGLSAATTERYDQAIHLNRKAPFGITEIQVMTFDLYRRVHCDSSSEDSHEVFVARRQALLRGDNE